MDWKDQLEEYGDLHNEDCDVNFEGGSYDGCHCENMESIKGFIEKVILERDKYWVKHLQAHRKYCSPQGNKELTKVKQQLRDKWLL